jgi:hypothetical protein
VVVWWCGGVVVWSAYLGKFKINDGNLDFMAKYTFDVGW